MASLAATMGMTVAYPFSTQSSRVLLFQPNLFPLKQRRTTPPTFSISSNNHHTKNLSVAPPSNDDGSSILSGSTRTVTTLFATAALCIKAFVNNILPPPDLCLSIGKSSSSLFFAAMIRRSSHGSLNTPLTVVAAGLKKWLDIYSGVLLVRVLLSWFPNIPWERQPLSAIRDLCDPYLSLFRNIVPPVFNSLDISPLLAFAVLGTLANILTVPV
jgi:uncharacterized protein YggT (Ycf19 family)